jgi:hypothetical protein
MGQNEAMTLALHDRTELLLAIAARADNEHVAALTPAEIDFAMTLEGRRLLHSVRLGSTEFRLSKAARELLRNSSAEALSPGF